MQPTATVRVHGGSHFGDRAFRWLTLFMALSIFVLIVLIGFELTNGSKLSLQKFETACYRKLRSIFLDTKETNIIGVLQPSHVLPVGIILPFCGRE